MNLVGIDLGIHKLAMALYVEGELASADVQESNSFSRGVQLAELAGRVQGYVALHEVDFVWIEDVLIGNNMKYSIGLAETKGAVLAALAKNFLQQGTDVRMVNVSTWKKDVLGKGNASKEDVMNHMRVTHPAYAPLCGEDQDLYDAACVGLYGLQVTQRAEGLRL